MGDEKGIVVCALPVYPFNALMLRWFAMCVDIKMLLNVCLQRSKLRLSYDTDKKKQFFFATSKHLAVPIQHSGNQ